MTPAPTTPEFKAWHKAFRHVDESSSIPLHLRSQQEIEQIIRSRIQNANLEGHIASLEPIQPGLSGAYPVKFTMSTGKVYFAKIVLDINDLQCSDADRCRRELENVTFGSDRGLAPKVVYIDRKQWTLITDFVSNQTMEAEARLSAIMRVAHRLHTCDPGRAEEVYDLDGGKRRWDRTYGLLPMGDRSDPTLKIAEAVADISGRELAQSPFVPGPVHGELNRYNVIISEGRGWLIDWGDLHYGDPAEELSYLLFSINSDSRGITDEDLGTQLKGYGEGVITGDNFRRFKLHLVWLRALRYLLTLIGNPWEDDEKRTQTLSVLREYVLEDRGWLDTFRKGLTPMETKS